MSDPPMSSPATMSACRVEKGEPGVACVFVMVFSPSLCGKDYGVVGGELQPERLRESEEGFLEDGHLEPVGDAATLFVGVIVKSQ